MKMTTPIHTRAGAFLALTIAIFLTAPSQAETNKIGIIDMQRVWDKYWKTKQAQAQVDDQTADFEKRKKGMLDDYQKANREYKKLIESAQDQAVSSDERDKRKSAAEKKLLEIKEIEQDANLFQRTTDEQLKMQARRMTENILRDIRGDAERGTRRKHRERPPPLRDVRQCRIHPQVRRAMVCSRSNQSNTAGRGVLSARASSGRCPSKDHPVSKPRGLP